MVITLAIFPAPQTGTSISCIPVATSYSSWCSLHPSASLQTREAGTEWVALFRSAKLVRHTIKTWLATMPRHCLCWNPLRLYFAIL